MAAELDYDLTPDQWRHFIEFYSEYYGLEALSDEIRTFIQRHGTDDQRRRIDSDDRAR